MSKDITTIVSLIVSFYAVGFFFNSFMAKAQENYVLQMGRAVDMDTVVAEDVMTILGEFLLIFATTALPAMVIIALATVLAVGAQTRFLFSQEQIKFKFERIDPIKGFKRMFSLRGLVELLKSLIKIILLTWILYLNISKTVQLLPAIIDWDIGQAAAYSGGEIISLIISTAIAFGTVAVLDFLYQRWEYEKNIRMTKQEVKDEYKQLEGNPEIKSARRQKQREYAQRRMMQQVQEADVVVRNPTHYAVALQYKLGVDQVPQVLAKGMDNIALKIVEEAEKHSILTVENRPLARSLYELADIDDVIPPELYQPVAELLAWMYSAKEKER